MSDATPPPPAERPGPAGRDAPSRAAGEAARFPHWRRNTVALVAANALVTTGFATSFPYLPLVLRELGLRGDLETWVGYTVGGFFAVSFFMTPVWGGFADHFGRKSMVLRAGLGMGSLLLVMSQMAHPALLIAVFVLMGTTNGFIPASLALAATNTPVAAMGRALSFLQSAALVGNTLGPALGAFLATRLPQYRHLLAVSGVLALVAGAMVLAFAREVRQPPRGPFRLHLLRDLALLLRVPGTGVLYGLNFLFALSFFGSVAVASVYTIELVHATGAAESEEYWVGVVSVAMALASAVALPFWGRLLDRFEVRRVLAVGLLTGTLGSIPVVLAATPVQLAAARLGFGLLASGIGPALVTLMKADAPPGMDARALSFGTAFAMLGIGAGPLASGFVGPALGLRTYFALNTVLLGLGFVLWWRHGLAPRRPG